MATRPERNSESGHTSLQGRRLLLRGPGVTVGDRGSVEQAGSSAAGSRTAANQLISGVVDEATDAHDPAVARRLHVSTAQLEAQLAQGYPAVVKGLETW